jgi:hypothetical protein
MGLPAGDFHQFLRHDSARPLQQFQNLVGLTAVAGTGGFLSAFGRFLRRGSLMGRLPFFFATWAPRGATRAFLVAFGCLPNAGAWPLPVSSVIDVFMFAPWAEISAITTWITPVRPESK